MELTTTQCFGIVAAEYRQSIQWKIVHKLALSIRNTRLSFHLSVLMWLRLTDMEIETQMTIYYSSVKRQPVSMYLTPKRCQSAVTAVSAVSAVSKVYKKSFAIMLSSPFANSARHREGANDQCCDYSREKLQGLNERCLRTCWFSRPCDCINL
jgi:hypothetical protein